MKNKKFAEKAREKKIRKAMDKIHKKYAETFKALAK